MNRGQKPWKPGDERCTPRWFARVVHRFVPRFAFVPCHCPGSHIRHRVGLGYDDDSLDSRWRWHRYTSVWLQPPYSDPEPFCERLVAAWLIRRAGRLRTDALMLGRGDWTTAWFRQLARYGPAVLLERRLAFELEGRTDAGAKFPSVLFYLGTRPQAFRAHFQPHGIFLPQDTRQCDE